jgi:TonB family protein
MAQLMFASLPSPASRSKFFLSSWCAQGIAVASFVAVSALFPQVVPKARHSVVTTLVPYENPQQQQQQQPRPFRRLSTPLPPVSAKASVRPRLVVPPMERTRRELDAKPPEVKMAAAMPDMPLPAAPKIVAMNTFSTLSSAVPTLTKPPAAVQTGGFGDPVGVTPVSHHGPSEINAFGSFDLPRGSQRGNGSGGAAAGVVASAGFGSGVLTSGPAHRGAVQASGFDTHASAPEPRAVAASSSPTTPVEILFKPKPDYTEEGRKLKIDGEVRLEVRFGSNGSVQVIKVLAGLGYGLDEEAVKAAEKIKFKPALHEGQPVDSTAVVHIIFALAS